MSHQVWIAYRIDLRRQRQFVCKRPSAGGVDWGYTLNESEAIALDEYDRNRFSADMRRLDRRPHFITK